MCQSRVDGNSYPPYSARRTKWIRIFSQRHETQIYILKLFIINRSTIAKLKLPNDMTVWFHLLTSPLVITSCQNGFLYSALATSSESDLKKQKKKKGKNKQTNQKKQNSAPDCERLLHCTEFGQGRVQIKICTDFLLMISTF